MNDSGFITASGDPIDPFIAEAVDSVGNRFGVTGLEDLLAYAESARAEAQRALDALAEVIEEPAEPLLPVEETVPDQRVDD